MNKMHAIALTFLGIAFLTGLAIISTSYGYVLPQSMGLYWLFFIGTLVSGNILLFSSVSQNEQIAPLKFLSILFFLLALVAFISIVLDLLGFVEAKKPFILWLFLIIAGVKSGLLQYFAQDLENGQTKSDDNQEL